jgi:hypothetical protein
MMLSSRATAPLPGRTLQRTRCHCTRPCPAAASKAPRRVYMRCAAAASDQKSPAEPMYLSDLITFEVSLSVPRQHAVHTRLSGARGRRGNT